MDRAEVVVVGGGHNGLVCACYLARAGLDVVVLEAAASPGGCIHTVELPGGRGRLEVGAYEHGGIRGSGVAGDLELESRFGLRFHLRDQVTLAPCDDGTAPGLRQLAGPDRRAPAAGGRRRRRRRLPALRRLGRGRGRPARPDRGRPAAVPARAGRPGRGRPRPPGGPVPAGAARVGLQPGPLGGRRRAPPGPPGPLGGPLPAVPGRPRHRCRGPDAGRRPRHPGGPAGRRLPGDRRRPGPLPGGGRGPAALRRPGDQGRGRREPGRGRARRRRAGRRHPGGRLRPGRPAAAAGAGRRRRRPGLAGRRGPPHPRRPAQRLRAQGRRRPGRDAAAARAGRVRAVVPAVGQHHRRPGAGVRQHRSWGSCPSGRR